MPSTRNPRQRPHPETPAGRPARVGAKIAGRGNSGPLPLPDILRAPGPAA